MNSIHTFLVLGLLASFPARAAATDIGECTQLAAKLATAAWQSKWPSRAPMVTEVYDMGGGTIAVTVQDLEDGNPEEYRLDTRFDEKGKCQADGDLYEPA